MLIFGVCFSYCCSTRNFLLLALMPQSKSSLAKLSVLQQLRKIFKYVYWIENGETGWWVWVWFFIESSTMEFDLYIKIDQIRRTISWCVLLNKKKIREATAPAKVCLRVFAVRWHQVAIWIFDVRNVVPWYDSRTLNEKWKLNI